tara:strand:- start:46 stop:285 length:240 start_codon:yes stop_codon:yes gene_type:complete
MNEVRYPKSMNFWYTIVDPEDKYPTYDYVRRIPEYYTDDDIDKVINAMMRKHGVGEMWYAIEKKGKYISSGVTTICRPI